MKSKIAIQNIALICVILFIIAGAVVIALDWKAMRQVIGQADWLYIAPSLIFTGVSYLCLSVSQAIVFQVFGFQIFTNGRICNECNIPPYTCRRRCRCLFAVCIIKEARYRHGRYSSAFSFPTLFQRNNVNSVAAGESAVYSFQPSIIFWYCSGCRHRGRRPDIAVVAGERNHIFRTIQGCFAAQHWPRGTFCYPP